MAENPDVADLAPSTKTQDKKRGSYDQYISQPQLKIPRTTLKRWPKNPSTFSEEIDESLSSEEEPRDFVPLTDRDQPNGDSENDEEIREFRSIEPSMSADFVNDPSQPYINESAGKFSEECGDKLSDWPHCHMDTIESCLYLKPSILR